MTQNPQDRPLLRLALSALALIVLAMATTLSAEPRDVFILTDVSASVIAKNDPQVIRDVQRLISDLAQGKFDAAKHSAWQPDPQYLFEPLKSIVAGSAGAQPMSGPTRRVILIPFGDKKVNHTPLMSAPITSFPADFNGFLAEHYPKTYRDQLTYLSLARATTAAVAETQGIRQYYFFAVTDALADSKSDYNESEDAKLKRWGSKNFVPDKTRIGVFEYRRAGVDPKNFQVDVWRVELELPPPPAEITLLKPRDGAALSGKTPLEWAIRKEGGRPYQPLGLNFNLSIVRTDTGAQVHAEQVSNAFSTVANLDGVGEYRLIIDGSRAVDASPDLPQTLGRLDTTLTAHAPSQIQLITPSQKPAMVDPGAQEIRWALAASDGRIEHPSGAKFRVSLTHNTNQRELFNSVVTGFSTSLTFPDSGDCRLTIAADEIPGKPNSSPLETVIVIRQATPPPKPEPVTPPPVPVAESNDPRIVILLPRDKSELKSDKITMRWRVEPGDTNVAQYRVRLSGPTKSETRVSGTTFSKKLTKSGSYRATVSVAKPEALAATIAPATIEFTTQTSDHSWIFGLLGIAIAIVILAMLARMGMLGALFSKLPFGRRRKRPDR